MTKVAVLSGEHRLLLARDWSFEAVNQLGIIGLNPSEAGSKKEEDNTSKKFIYFADKWGFNRIEVGNLFTVISSSPKILKTYPEPVHHLNETFIRKILENSNRVMLCWGADKFAENEASKFFNKYSLEFGHKFFQYGPKLNRNGSPPHPLYMSQKTEMFPYTGKIERQDGIS